MASLGQYLREKREERRMSIAELARATRVPVASVERIESDQFDELPAEVFVRGFLKSYARAVGVSADDVLARYTSSRRVAWVTPLPLPSAQKPARGRRVGVAVAFVLLLILFTLALSIVLKPRGRDMPQELSLNLHPFRQRTSAPAEVFPATQPSLAAHPAAQALSTLQQKV